MDSHEESGQLKVILKGGASLVQSRPLISADSKWLTCCCGQDVRVYSISSGHCVHTLRAHSARVTALAAHPTNQFQFYSCCMDGMIVKWDASDGVLLKKYVTSYPLLAILPLNSSNMMFGLSPSLAQDKTADLSSAELIRFSLPSRDAGTIPCTQILHRILPADNAFTLGCKHCKMCVQSSYIAAVSKKKLLVLLLSEQTKTHSWKLSKMEDSMKKSGEFTCVAAHPQEACVATGMLDGKIILWWNVLGEKKKVIMSIYHWHSLAVCDLMFSSHGSCLLSGGHECVLVRWQHNSNQRDFLPRLGAPIQRLTVSSDNTIYAASQSDNGIQVVSSSLKVIQVIQGMTRSQWHSRSKGHDPLGLTLDPRSQAVVSSGKPGHIQFYHLQRDTQLYNLDIVGHNYISPDNLQRPLVSTEVECVAFNEAGSWMATVERRDDRVTAPEIRLKFWAFDDQSQEYSLNTTVELPHRQRVVTIKFRPGAAQTDMLISCSLDGTFKLWACVDDTDIYRKHESWSCESVGFYRDLPASAADFSDDGSVMALAFDNVLTLWEPDSTALCEVFPHPDPIKQVSFCFGNYSNLVMTTTESAIYVWDVMTCAFIRLNRTSNTNSPSMCFPSTNSVHPCIHLCVVPVAWSESISAHLIHTSKHSRLAAVFTSQHELRLYKPSSCTPVYTHSKVSDHLVTSAIFVPQASPSAPLWQGASQLYFTNSAQELLTIEKETQNQTPTASEQEKLIQKLPSSILSELLTQHKKASIQSEPTLHQQRGEPAKQFLSELLKTPAHVLPPVDSLCMPFLDQLMIHKTSNTRMTSVTQEVADSDMDVDTADNSDDDNDTVTKRRHHLLPSPCDSSQTDAEFSSLTKDSFNWMRDLK